MKKVFILLENYFNGAILIDDHEWHVDKYVGVFPTWKKAHDAICQKRQNQVEEAKAKSISLPSPIKKEFGRFRWTWIKENDWEDREEDWSYEIREDTYEEE